MFSRDELLNLIKQVPAASGEKQLSKSDDVGCVIPLEARPVSELEAEWKKEAEQRKDKDNENLTKELDKSDQIAEDEV